jgi:glycerophosphoryl diester phosphodiesterase
VRGEIEESDRAPLKRLVPPARPSDRSSAGSREGSSKDSLGDSQRDSSRGSPGGVLESLLHRGVDLVGEDPAGPAILGLRGSPLEAPENTIASLQRALDLGLDGLAYDVRACATGEPVLLRDETLDRTTDGRGRLVDRTLPEISTLDAGVWFGARFRGEPLALLEEALEAGGAACESPRGRSPARSTHVLWLRERGLVPEVERILRRRPSGLAVRIATTSRETSLEARDAGLEPMLVLHDAAEEDLDFVRAERIAACAMGPSGWRTAVGSKDWGCERWSLGVDSPGELIQAFRAGVSGVATREPLRALSTRALGLLAPSDRGPYPVVAPEIPIDAGESVGLVGTRGEWCGRWTCDARVRNPFSFPAEITALVLPRHGAFEADGVPRRFELQPGAEESLSFRLTGGSWRPGGDPLLCALFRWKTGKGRKSGALLLDAPLVRIRRTVADFLPVRLPMLRESPGDPDASMIVRRRGRQLFVSIENPAGSSDPRTIVSLAGRFHYGGRGLRAVLPEDFDRRREGVPFSCGFEAREGDARVVRRWAGGVPDVDGVGSPGLLFPGP